MILVYGFYYIIPCWVFGRLVFGFVANWLFSGFRGGKHNTGPTFTSMHRNQRGGIVNTDEEAKNARQHRKKIR